MPTTTVDQRTRAVLAAGLAWLYDTVQPVDAIPNHHGYSTAAGERLYRFIGQGHNGLPVVVVDVARPHYDKTRDPWVLLNGLDGPAEMRRVAELLAELGHPVADQWNGHDGCVTGSLGLGTPAHPTLLAGLRRYRDGCPQHHSVFCRQDHGCTWLRDGLTRTVKPSWPPAQETAGGVLEVARRNGKTRIPPFRTA